MRECFCVFVRVDVCVLASPHTLFLVICFLYILRRCFSLVVCPLSIHPVNRQDTIMIEFLTRVATTK